MRALSKRRKIQVTTLCMMVLLASSASLDAQSITAESLIPTESGQANLQQNFPYVQSVAQFHSKVHSGPGDSHYATERLPRGTQVKIFRHDLDGWMAIQPPQGSFSLVRAKYVLASFQNGEGKVTRDGVKAWVGTSIEQNSVPLWQVELDRNEPVRIRGKRRIKDENGRMTLWYEIEPPRGEFRWIHKTAFEQPVVTASNQQPANVPATNNGWQNPGTEKTTNNNTVSNQVGINQVANQNSIVSNVPQNGAYVVPDGPIQPKPFQSTPLGQETQVLSNIEPKPLPSQTISPVNYQQDLKHQFQATDGWQAAGNPKGRNVTPVSATEDVNESVQLVEPFPNSISGQSKMTTPRALQNAPTSNGNAITNSGPINNGPINNGQIAMGFQQYLARLEYEFSESLLNPAANHQQLALLRTKATQLHLNAKGETEIAKANSLLYKIDSAINLNDQRNAARLAQNPLQNQNNSSAFSGRPPVRQASATTNRQANSTTTEQTIYAGRGWLNRLYTDGGERPNHYVLQDENGKIIKTVSAPPGMNLDRYLHKEVGLMGQRGYHQRFQIPHVAVERIVEMDRHRR